MKNILAIALCLATPVAFAQTCAAPGGPATGANTPFTASGNTCSGADATFGSSICSGQTITSGTPVAIYAVQVGATNAFSFSVADTAPFDSALALIGPGACANSTGCVDSNDANGAGGGERLPQTGNFAQQSAGTYYAAIFSFNTGTAACGAYTLTVNPTLPVQLQSFTVG
jgi:hypothetical protein